MARGKTNFDPEQAEKEGWSIAFADWLNCFLILSHDDGDFACSGHAIAHCRDQADAGSQYHRDALKLAKLI